MPFLLLNIYYRFMTRHTAHHWKLIAHSKSSTSTPKTSSWLCLRSIQSQVLTATEQFQLIIILSHIWVSFTSRINSAVNRHRKHTRNDTPKSGLPRRTCSLTRPKQWRLIHRDSCISIKPAARRMNPLSQKTTTILPSTSALRDERQANYYEK